MARNGNSTELKDYRQQILKLFTNDKEICELVLGRIINTVDNSDIQDEMTKEHVYRFRKVPTTSEEMKTCISMLIQGEKSPANDRYKRITLTIYIFTHQDIIECTSSENDEYLGYLRTDLINERVEDLLNGYSDLGLGTLVCSGASDAQFDATHHGRQVTFRTLELNETLGY